MDVYKPYNKLFQSPKIKMLKSRKSTDVNRKDSITIKLKAGMEAVMLLDPIHENLSFFTRSAFDQYNYNVVNISHYDGHNTYLLSPTAADLEFSLLMAGDQLSPFIGDEEVDPQSDAFSQFVMNHAYEE